MRDKIIGLGVKQLNESYPGQVTAENILTDYLFAGLFMGTLKMTIEDCPQNVKGRQVTAECQKLIDEINKNIADQVDKTIGKGPWVCTICGKVIRGSRGVPNGRGGKNHAKCLK